MRRQRHPVPLPLACDEQRSVRTTAVGVAGTDTLQGTREQKNREIEGGANAASYRAAFSILVSTLRHFCPEARRAHSAGSLWGPIKATAAQAGGPAALG